MLQQSNLLACQHTYALCMQITLYNVHFASSHVAMFVHHLVLLIYLLGPLDAPYNFSVARSNTSFNLYWGAPFSLHVTGYYANIFNYTLCTNITIYGCKTIPSDPDCTFPRTCTSSVDFTDPSLNGTNKTIVDYGDLIKFTIFAINGAGNGNMAHFLYLKGLYTY